MIKRILVTAMVFLVGLAALLLLLDAVFPSLLDPRTITAWRRHSANVVPMPFYAKVVDENGEPVLYTETVALGASPAGPFGPIAMAFDLRTIGVGSSRPDHSAQFNHSNFEVASYWSRVLLEAGM